MLRNRTILLRTRRQLLTVLAIIELDGVVRRLVLAPPDIDITAMPQIIADAGIDIVISDNPFELNWGVPVVALRPQPIPVAEPATRTRASEWVLFTSGTNGRPKMVVHDLQSLSGALQDRPEETPHLLWSTFYDVRRYGGLQILLRAFAGRCSMLLSDARESTTLFLLRAAAAGVTHISGTASHWRLALMSPAIAQLSPAYVRLSGEIADQAILDHLYRTFPNANISHAFASTEAGVAFDVRDGLAGFPQSWVGATGGSVEMRVVDGSLRIRSGRVAANYAGQHLPPLADAEGFIDTGDMVELRAGRYYFVGRREGVINVGGLKVHPEEVEAVVNLHPCVQASRVQGRPNPITGAIVVASVVIKPDSVRENSSFITIRHEILKTCRKNLAPHKVPVMLQEVAMLDVAPSGKLVRPRA
jgi:acyl-coenzyme A synthetase/AMP-(fatty) acid ligase